MKKIIALILFLFCAANVNAQFNSYTNREFARIGNISLRLDVFTPISGNSFPTIIYIHGGGWNSGNRQLDSVQTRQIGRGYAVVGIDYRLSQQAKFPAQIYDVKAAIRYLRANAQTFNLDPNKFAFFGRSAGGHLAITAALSSAVGELEDLSTGNPNQPSNVSGVFDWFGPTDLLRFSEQALNTCTPFCFECEGSPLAQLIGGDTRSLKLKTNRANPRHYLRQGFTYPSFLIVHGTADCTVPPMQSQIFNYALQNFGIDSSLTVVANGGHGGTQFETAERLAEMDAFFDRILR